MTQPEPRGTGYPEGTDVLAKLVHKDRLEFYFRAHEQEIFFAELPFQSGPIGEHGVNGATNEAVIEGVIMRLRVLNDLMPCRENSLAITKLEESLHWLNARTADRRARGVEGSNTP